MDFRDVIELNRSNLELIVDAEKLYPQLQQDHVITDEEISHIEILTNKPAKVGKLLDIILSKDTAALQSLYLVLQNVYQQQLSSIFSEPPFSISRGSQQAESCSTSITSDSEDDVSRGQINTDSRPELRSKMTKIIPSHQYDPNSTMSSSFPTSREHLSPMSVSKDNTSPSLASLCDALPKHGYPDKTYDWFFMQFERAFKELQVLKQQNDEMMAMKERYDQVTKEAKQLRGMYQAESQCLNKATAEIHALKAQQTELLAEKNQLLDELSGLRKQRVEDKHELSELRHQQRKAASECSSNDSMGEMYASLLDKYESMHKDYDVLREKYSELMGSHGTALSRLEAVAVENSSFHGQLKELQIKCEALSSERNGLKQQCTNAIREWNQTLINYGQVKEKLALVIKQRDDYCKDFNQTFSKHAELKKNYEALRNEKDAAVKEYALVMSERDTVHKEIEQLQDKLNAVTKHAEMLTSDKKEKELELETLRRDMANILSERDKYRRERNDFSGINQGLQMERLEIQKQRDIARKEIEQMEHIFKDTFEKERAEEMDSIVKESENLKKQLEKLKIDLESAEQEAENANKNRDKAFSERDKIVQERESIRTLCDNLRRDRDHAVSDLAQALRDSDEFKRQKNDAIKELKEIKSRYEAIVEKDTRRQQLHYIGHNHSRDSAIDADLQDLGSETVEISIELETNDDGEVGFEILGGKDDPQFHNDPSLIVSHVTKGGLADGKLRVNDTILRINSLETINIEKRSARQAIWKTTGPINMLVRRRKSSHARIWQPVQIVLACQKDPGIQIEQGLYISRICPGGLVAKYGMLPCIGDRIISINNTPTDGLSANEAMRILETSTDSLVLDVMRQKSPLSSAGSSPTPTFIGINSPLPENIAVSSNMSKSDTLAIRSSSWETPSDTSRSMESSKIVRSSGSQTDSLDSPGPSPRKAMRSQEHDKVRHSLPMLDRAKEKVEKFLKSRHKSHEKELAEKKEKEEDDPHLLHDPGKSFHKLNEDNGTRMHLHSAENVIAEFPNSMLSKINTNASDNRTSRTSRKGELDFDSNSGTWPKTRGQQIQNSSGPPTVIFAPGHRPVKERPSIKDVFYSDSSPYDVHPSPQVFDAAKPPGPVFTTSVAPSAFSPTTPSTISVPSYPVHNVAPVLTSPLPHTASFTIPVSTKSSAHFSVGITHGPPSNSSQSSVIPSRGPPVFAKPSPAATYGSNPLNKPGAGNRNSLVSPYQTNIQPVGPAAPQDFRFETTPHRVQGPPKPQPVKPRRPISTPYKSEKHWQTPSAINWPPGRVTPESLPGHINVQTLAGTNQRLSSPNTSFSTPSQYYMGVNSSGGSSQLFSNPPPYNRPASLEVSQFIKVTDYASDIYERKRMSSPMGYPQSYHQYHPVSTISSPQVSTNQHAALSSPNGTFPVIGSSDIEPERQLSFHGAPAEHYNSPSPSQKSYSTLDRFTPTLNEDFYPPRYSGSSPHSRNFIEEDPRQAAFNKRDTVFDKFRIPSTTSIKSGSAEIVSNRSSPSSPMFHVRDSVKYNGAAPSDEYIYRRKTPSHHETRDITFEKSSKPVGFKIQRGPQGGIFVSSVNENSLAAQAGLVIGDQLLEVCGINMRNANYDHAVTVLRQCGDNLIIKVQYNPEKYTDQQDVSSSVTSINSSSLTTSPSHSMQTASEKSTTKSQQSPTKSRVAGFGDNVDIRRSIILKKSNPNMMGPGFSFKGGNAVGIFIDEIFANCFVDGANLLQRGDQLLEYNSVDFRTITAEKAMMELNIPCPSMQICVFYNFAKFKKIQTMPCDSFYVRANFDRPSETEENLSFHKDDILYVENSLYNGHLGSWYAWLVNEHGTKLKSGVIPSRIRLEDEMTLRRSHSDSWSIHESDELKGSRRNSMSSRRSFFRRKRHLRNNSKDSQDFISYSDASFNTDSLDDSLLGYTQVEKIEFKTARPVVLLAPLAEALIRKLESESPDLYKYCQPIAMNYSPATLEKSLSEGVLLDYWKEDDTFMCIRSSEIKDICDHNLHCLLSVKPAAIERLHQSKIYPITIYVHHKSSKQIRDVRDPQFLKDRPNNKWAKEQFEHFQKIEQEFQHLFTAVIQAGNLAEMCMQIKTVISSEQKKAIWVTVNTI